jgi:hypothetical protein
MDAEAKIRAEDTRIMLADLGGMDDETRSLVPEEARRNPHARRLIHIVIVKHHGLFWTIFVVLAMFVPLLDYILCHIRCTM